MKKRLLCFVVALVFVINVTIPVLANEISSSSTSDSISAALPEVQLPDAGILPGNPVYFLDKLIEKIVIVFTFSPEKKAERLLGDANERLAEAEELAESGEQELADQTSQEYLNTMEEVQVQITIAINDGKVSGTVYSDVYTVVSDNKSKNVVAVVYGMDLSQRNAAIVLLRVLAKSPEQARKGLLNAFENQLRHQLEEYATVLVQIDGKTVTLNIYPKLKHDSDKSANNQDNKKDNQLNNSSTKQGQENYKDNDKENKKDKNINSQNKSTDSKKGMNNSELEGTKASRADTTKDNYAGRAKGKDVERESDED